MAALATREPLAALPPVFSKERMLGTISFLTQTKLREEDLAQRGLTVQQNILLKNSGRQDWNQQEMRKGVIFRHGKRTSAGLGHAIKMKNVVGVIPGKKKEFSGQSVVIGAHYDHLGLGWPDVRDENRGKVHPGADDNASGVAVLIELAGELRKNLNPGAQPGICGIYR